VKGYIQAVPERMVYIARFILPRLALAGLAVDVVCDHDHVGELWNSVRIWERIAAGSEPAVVVQDDVIVHAQFGEHLPDIAGHVARGAVGAVSLYAPDRRRWHQRAAQDANFVAPGVPKLPGMIYAPAYARGVLDYIAAGKAHAVDDMTVEYYARDSGNPVWNTIPSLVQHDLNVPSSLGHKLAANGKLRRSPFWQRDIPAGHWAQIRHGGS
jgi:GR25 family glycosyltransferase involved in LPS biosynthesis